jgi:hypothetical protein
MVMDAGQNKATDEVVVNVIDVRCGQGLNKVLVCHKEKKVQCVTEAAAKVHLAHGDVLGGCNTIAAGNTARPGSSQIDDDRLLKLRVVNFPNPVASITRIQYEIPFDGQLSISVFDVSGRKVKTLVNSNINAGHHSTYFDASALQNGVYYYKVLLQKGTKELKQTGKMIIAK